MFYQYHYSVSHCCIFCSEHDAIAKEIRVFLDLPSARDQDEASTTVLKQNGNVKKRRNN